MAKKNLFCHLCVIIVGFTECAPPVGRCDLSTIPVDNRVH